MSNIHPADKRGYICPDKGNRFPLKVYGGTKQHPTCPGCGADLKFFLARDASVEPAPDPDPEPESGS